MAARMPLLFISSTFPMNAVKAEAIVDVQQDKIIKTLHFDSETGMPQYDPIARKVYVNLQDQNIFAVIDPQTDEVVGALQR
jgi:hypothetical protein